MLSSTQDTHRDTETLGAIERFNEAFESHAVPAIMACMTPDCVFESTYPPPDGERLEGQDAVRGAWEALFQSSPDARFEAEEVIPAGDRCTVRWVYRYSNRQGEPQHLRGVDVFRVRDGKVAEKYSYVKG